MRVAAIIQARMGSSRFPGKVLRSLAGKPVLWHIVHRLGKCKNVDVVAIATTTAPADDAIEAYARRLGLSVVRGPEDDVLSRYVVAADTLEAEVVVRVTGDAPLVDPTVVDLVIAALLDENAEWCIGDPRVPTIHEGFDPFTAEVLRRLQREAGNDPVAREHVSAYFKQNPGFARTAHARLPCAHAFSGARLSVDTPADLRFLEELHTRVGAPAGEIRTEDVIDLLRSSPELLQINGHVRQKSANAAARRVLFRCDGSHEVGLGHVVRCLALADEFRERHGWGVAFAMFSGESGFQLVQGSGYELLRPNGAGDPSAWIENVMAARQPDAVVLDVRDSMPPESLRRWRQMGITVVVLDDPSDRRLAADLTFCPPVPQVSQLNWDALEGRLHVGWDWVVLRRQFAAKREKKPNDPPKILITMGGSDPADLTLRAVRVLDRLRLSFEGSIVLGAAYRGREALASFVDAARHRFCLHQDVSSMADLMLEADLAVASFGVTAYELAAVGVPSVLLALTEDHSISASVFHSQGVAVSLGLHERVLDGAIEESVAKLLQDVAHRRSMAQRAKTLVDGLGAERIAVKVVERVTQIGRGPEQDAAHLEVVHAQ